MLTRNNKNSESLYQLSQKSLALLKKNDTLVFIFFIIAFSCALQIPCPLLAKFMLLPLAIFMLADIISLQNEPMLLADIVDENKVLLKTTQLLSINHSTKMMTRRLADEIEFKIPSMPKEIFNITSDTLKKLNIPDDITNIIAEYTLFSVDEDYNCDVRAIIKKR